MRNLIHRNHRVKEIEETKEYVAKNKQKQDKTLGKYFNEQKEREVIYLRKNSKSWS